MDDVMFGSCDLVVVALWHLTLGSEPERLLPPKTDSFHVHFWVKKHPQNLQPHPSHVLKSYCKCLSPAELHECSIHFIVVRACESQSAPFSLCFLDIFTCMSFKDVQVRTKHHATPTHRGQGVPPKRGSTGSTARTADRSDRCVDPLRTTRGPHPRTFGRRNARSVGRRWVRVPGGGRVRSTDVDGTLPQFGGSYEHPLV